MSDSPIDERYEIAAEVVFLRARIEALEGLLREWCQAHQSCARGTLLLRSNAALRGEEGK